MSYRSVAVWRAPLEGHVFDLEDLPVYMDGCPVQVLHVAGAYQLALPIGVAGSSHAQVLEVAAEFGELINGATSLLLGSYRPIELAKGAFSGVDEDGTPLSTVVPLGTAEERCKAKGLGVSEGIRGQF